MYDTKSEEKCRVVYRKQCSMVYETVTDLEYEQKCSTSYEQQCHGYGYHQTCEEVRLSSYVRNCLLLYLCTFIYLHITYHVL